MNSTKSLILGYWNVRGRGGVVRSLLHYCEVPYEERVYTQSEEWFGGEKYKLGLDFPNLPYIIDGDVKIAEVNALMNYVPIKGNKKELLGESDVNKVKVSEAVSVINDLRAAVRNTCSTKGDFNKDFDDLLTKGQAKTILTHFEKVLEKKDWIVGSLSIADFWLFEQVDWVFIIDASKLDVFPNLLKFHKRFIEIPQVKAHRESDRFYQLWILPWKNPAWNNTEVKK